jgi:hypothetical protein
MKPDLTGLQLFSFSRMPRERRRLTLISMQSTETALSPSIAQEMLVLRQKCAAMKTV